MSEQILVVKRVCLSDYLRTNGLITTNCDEIISIIKNNFEFIDREDAENDPNYKQIIPYVALVCGDKVFTTQRLNKGTEERLHGLLSIGIGGHINKGDLETAADPLAEGMLRELGEEVYIKEPGEMIPIGLINDDSNEVGSVHLGLFYKMKVGKDVEVIEKEKLLGKWFSISELKKSEEGRMETWAEIGIQAL